MERRRDLVDQNNVRSRLDGKKKTLHIQILFQTWRLINRIVETGAGKYGSAFIEHGVRFFMACLAGNKENIDVVVKELKPFVITSDFANNLRRFADAWESEGSGESR